MQGHKVYIGLGSNLGDRVAHLREAVRQVQNIMTVDKVSQLYVAAPLGYVRNDAFINAALSGYTQSKPMDLLVQLQAIERKLGRRRVQYGPRPIDLDILFYGALEVDAPGLSIPHPRLADRAFVLKPLVDIDPKLMHPVLYYTVSQLLHEAEDADQVHVYTPSP